MAFCYFEIHSADDREVEAASLSPSLRVEPSLRPEIYLNFGGRDSGKWAVLLV